jgi:plasmid replication initiation protein
MNPNADSLVDVDAELLEIEPVGRSGAVGASGASGALQTDSPLHGAINGQIDLMAYPFFSLSKRPSKRAIRFIEGAVSVEVRPSENGVATIYDKEILIYLASLAIDRLERGEAFDGVLTFTAYDFFKLVGLSGASGKNYQRLASSLDRLQGTQVRTTIETGGVNIDGWFSWISEAQVIFSRDSQGQKRARAFRVRITDWLVRAIAADGSVLSYERDYFRLTAIERRLYEIARAGCVSGAPMTIDLTTLRQRVGVTSPLKKFRQLLAQIAEKDALPSYRVAFMNAEGKQPLGRVRLSLAPRSHQTVSGSVKQIDHEGAQAGPLK